MSYVDGFIVPVPKKNLDACRKLARQASEVWKENGALACVKCIGDDVPPGKVTSFDKSVQLKRGEVVASSWIVYKSRAQRDRINKKVMADPRLADLMSDSGICFSLASAWSGAGSSPSWSCEGLIAAGLRVRCRRAFAAASSLADIKRARSGRRGTSDRVMPMGVPCGRQSFDACLCAGLEQAWKVLTRDTAS